MHRLEITGATPEELYVNSLNMLSMLVRGSAAITVPAEQTGAVADTQPPEGQVFTTSSTAETAPAKPQRGRRASKAATAELNDPIPDLAAKTIEHDPKEIGGKPPELTLDGDIRPRLRAIQKACTDRGENMQDTVAYIMKLYGPFGVQKADQLKPEQFVEFMEASEGYLSGEA